MKRVFLIVLDSVGIGEMPDAAQYGDEGSNTVAAAASSLVFLILTAWTAASRRMRRRERWPG